MLDFSNEICSVYIHISTYIHTTAFTLKHNMIKTGTARVNNILSNHKINETTKVLIIYGLVMRFIRGFILTLFFFDFARPKMISLRYYFLQTPSTFICFQVYIYTMILYICIDYYYLISYPNLFTSKSASHHGRLSVVFVRV